MRPPGSHGPHSSPGQSHGPPPHRPGSNHGLPARHPLGSPIGHGPRHPLGSPLGHPQSPGPEPLVKVKAEVKAEPEGSPPEYRPASPRDDAPRLGPKIKHTDAKDRRPRYPLGPYAPQYGPYGPYAPPEPHAQHRLHQFHPVQNMNPKPQESPHYVQLRPHYGPAHYAPHPGLPHPDPVLAAPDTQPEEARAATPPVDLHKPAETDRITPPPASPERLAPVTDKEPEKAEEPPNPPQEGSVFGGLVSYFSSQREEDDIDA